MSKKVRSSLLIGIDKGSPDMLFLTATNRLVARGYTRVVIGKRGPYIEFTREQIQWDNFYVPHNQQYRWTDERAFYIEYRSKDDANIMLYLQKRTVAYADYRINMCYISPMDVMRAELQPVIMA